MTISQVSANSWTRCCDASPSGVLFKSCKLFKPAPGNMVPARSLQRVTTRAGKDDPPELRGDWRSFRAGLIASSVNAKVPGEEIRVSQENLELLRQQDAELASEGTWAHPTETAETGGLLLATPKAPSLLNDARFWQIVIFLVSHGPQGSTGVILNRPAVPTLGDLLNNVDLGELSVLARAFAAAPLYLGGFYAPNKLRRQALTCLHGHKELVGGSNGPLLACREVVPGIYMGGEIAGAKAVEEGQFSAHSFRFFAGVMSWGPGQLNLEVNSGIWHTAACSRTLVLKQCLGLPTPLWREAMELLGGEYSKAARNEYEAT